MVKVLLDLQMKASLFGMKILPSNKEKLREGGHRTSRGEATEAALCTAQLLAWHH